MKSADGILIVPDLRLYRVNGFEIEEYITLPDFEMYNPQILCQRLTDEPYNRIGLLLRCEAYADRTSAVKAAIVCKQNEIRMLARTGNLDLISLPTIETAIINLLESACDSSKVPNVRARMRDIFNKALNF